MKKSHNLNDLKYISKNINEFCFYLSSYINNLNEELSLFDETLLNIFSKDIKYRDANKTYNKNKQQNDLGKLKTTAMTRRKNDVKKMLRHARIIIRMNNKIKGKK